MADYHCILFDLGGIVVPESGDHVLAAMSHYLNVEAVELMNWFQHFFAELTTGRKSLLDAYTVALREMAPGLNPKDALCRHLEAYAEKAGDWDQDVIGLINQLRRKMTVACLTNTEIEIAEFNRKAGLFNLFDQAFLSTELGLAKPGSEIYMKVSHLLELEPYQIIFIDDRPENVQAAKDIGMNALHYDNLDHLAQKLTEAGVV